MKHVLQQFVVLFFLIILVFIPGCFRIPKEDVQEAIKDSREYYNKVIKYAEEHGEDKEVYSQELEQARNWLQQAEEQLNKFRLNEAFWAAVKSRTVSQQIIERIYEVTTEETQETIKNPQRYYDEVKYAEEKVEDKEKYAQNIEMARKWLSLAKEHLEKSHLNEAVLAAIKSTVISQQIITRFYAKDFPLYVKQVKAEITNRLNKDSEDPAYDFLQQIDSTLGDIEKVVDNPQLVYIDKVLRDIDEVRGINTWTKLFL
jgi:hypothetical protein